MPRARKERTWIGRVVASVFAKGFATVAVVLTFVVALVVGVFLHLDTAVVKRLVATQATAILGGIFEGRIVVERVGNLGVSGLGGVRGRVLDPEGKEVLFVDGVRVRIRTRDLVRSLFAHGDVVVPVDVASIDHVAVSLDADPAGQLALVRAFAPRHPSPPSPSPTRSGVRVDAPAVRLNHAWVYGKPGDAPLVDVELHDLRLGVHYDDDATRATLEGVEVLARALPAHVDPRGTLRGRFSMPSESGRAYGASADFDGVVARVPTRLHASLDGEHVEALVDMSDPSAAGVRALVPGLELRDDVTVHVEARGDLPAMTAKARVTAGRATLDLDASATVAGRRSAHATVRVRSVDLHAVRSSLPASNLGLDLVADVALPDEGPPSGTVTVDTLPGTLAGRAAPPLKVRAEFTGANARLHANVQDARMPTSLDVTTTPTSNGFVAAVNLASRVPELAEVASLAGLQAAGSAKIDASGTVRMPQGALDVTARVDGTGVAYDTTVVDEVHARVRVTGTLERPIAAVATTTSGIWVGKMRVPSLDVAGEVSVTPGGARVRDVVVSFVRRDVPGSLRASQVEVEGSRIRVKGAELTGLGEVARVDFSRDDREIAAAVDAPSIDLSRVAKIADLHELHGGTLGVRGAFVLRERAAEGEVHARLEGLAVGNLRGGRATIDATIDGPRIGLDLDASLEQVGNLSLSAKRLVLGGNPAKVASWEAAYGSTRIDGSLDLRKFASLLPADTLPVDAAGRVTIAGTIARDDATSPPEARVHVETSGLVVVARGASEATKTGLHVKDVAPFRFDGVDIGTDVRVDGTTGNSEFALRLTDAAGLLLALDAKALLPYREFFVSPASAIAKLETAPLAVKLIIPKRPLARMPSWVGTRAYGGTVEADFEANGTILEPRAEFTLRAREIRATSTRRAVPVDADVTASYDGATANVGVEMRERDKRWLALTSRIDAKVRDWIEHPDATDRAWRAGARVTIDGFELDNVGALIGQRLRGTVRGTVTLEDLHEDAKLHGRLDLERLAVGRALYPRGVVSVDAEAGRLQASARVDQTDGFLEAGVASGVRWGKELVPSLDDTQPVEAHLAAKAFRAAAILPFVRNVFNELDGRIDADAKFALDPRSQATKMSGQIRFQEGVLQMAMFGDELRDANATVTLRPDGTIAIDDVRASSAQGKITADGVVVTKGLDFERATGNVHIAEKEALDFILEGQPLGQVFGSSHVEVRKDAAAKKLSVAVDVPELQLKLPQALKVGVQDLSRDPRIRVGTFTDASTFVKLKLDKGDEEEVNVDETVTQIDVTLGSIVVRRGSQIKVQFTGKPRVVIANGKTEMSGQVELRSGTVDLQGKVFKVESGTITFQPEDLSNPIVVATASWDPGDGTRVFADFVGPVKHGKLTLRSEPSMPPNEILALVMFGSSSGMNRSNSGSAGGAAIGAGGGLATQGLTEALDDLAGIQATARIDTSQANNPRPEIEVQVSPTVSVQVAHVLGNPPITDPDLNLATVDWRFRRNWSLETTIGDRGKAMIDAVWQKRY